MCFAGRYRKRPQLSNTDRLLFVWLYRWFTQARFHNRAVNGRTLYVPGLAAIAGLADFSDQSCRWHRGNRPLRAADDNVPAALLPCDSVSRTSTVGNVRGDDKSDRGVDFAPDHRGVSLGQFTSLSYSGPRHCVRRGLQAAVACHGHSGQADRAPIAVAEPVRREADRLDPTGMSRPHDRIWGGAPAPDPGSVCRVL